MISRNTKAKNIKRRDVGLAGAEKGSGRKRPYRWVVPGKMNELNEGE